MEVILNEEDIIVVNNDIIVVGFINSYGKLEYTQYKNYDGGTVDIKDSKEYSQKELAKLLLDTISS